MTGKKLVWIRQDKTKDFWLKGLTPVEYIGKTVEYISIKEVADIMDYNDIIIHIFSLTNNRFSLTEVLKM